MAAAPARAHAASTSAPPPHTPGRRRLPTRPRSHRSPRRRRGRAPRASGARRRRRFVRPTQRVGGVLHTYFAAVCEATLSRRSLRCRRGRFLLAPGPRCRHGARANREDIGGTSPYQSRESRPCRAALSRRSRHRRRGRGPSSTRPARDTSSPRARRRSTSSFDGSRVRRSPRGRSSRRHDPRASKGSRRSSVPRLSEREACPPSRCWRRAHPGPPASDRARCGRVGRTRRGAPRARGPPVAGRVRGGAAVLVVAKATRLERAAGARPAVVVAAEGGGAPRR